MKVNDYEKNGVWVVEVKGQLMGGPDTGELDEKLYAIIGKGNKKAIVDLAIMSMMEHMIMTTGTYGWWGAWLANGRTVYYQKWPRPNSTLSKGFVREDFFPPYWIPMT